MTTQQKMALPTADSPWGYATPTSPIDAIAKQVFLYCTPLAAAFSGSLAGAVTGQVVIDPVYQGRILHDGIITYP